MNTERVLPPVGTVVVDRESRPASPGVAVVITPRSDPADAIVIPELGRTVAAVNPGYPPDDDVVDVLFVGDLDNAVGSSVWRSWPASTFGLDYRVWANANVDLEAYSYPASRVAIVGPVVVGTDAGGYVKRAKQTLDEDEEGEDA